MSQDRPMARPVGMRPAGGDSLADVLERVLDKGLVIAGDVQVNLLDIEVLTIKVRLLLASADTAQQMGIDWWNGDPFLSSRARGTERERDELKAENAELRARLDRLEARLLPAGGEQPDTEEARDRETAERPSAPAGHEEAGAGP